MTLGRPRRAMFFFKNVMNVDVSKFPMSTRCTSLDKLLAKIVMYAFPEHFLDFKYLTGPAKSTVATLKAVPELLLSLGKGLGVRGAVAFALYRLYPKK